MNPILLPQVYTMHGKFGFTVNNNLTLLGKSLRTRVVIIQTTVYYVLLSNLIGPCCY